MERFAKARRLASWAGMCPGRRESAGKRGSGRTRKGNRYLRRILCEIAHEGHAVRAAEEGSDGRGGGQRAVVAVGHKILLIAFAMLGDRKPYQDPDLDYDQLLAQRNRHRPLRNTSRPDASAGRQRRRYAWGPGAFQRKPQTLGPV